METESTGRNQQEGQDDWRSNARVREPNRCGDGNRDYRQKTLTLDGARHAITAAVAQAYKNHAGGVIAVVDDREF